MLMRTIVVRLVFHIVTVSCYSDVRRTSCMSDMLTEKIPANRSKWSGVIEMTMQCDDGYDFALNTPNNAVFQCKPNGGPWDPSYIPDCNRVIVPDKLYVLLGLHLDRGKCGNIQTNIAREEKLQLGSPFQDADIGQLCNNRGFQGCKISDITQICGGKIAEIKEDSDYWKDELKENDGNSPYVVVTIKFDYDTTKKSYVTELPNLSDDIKTAISWRDTGAFNTKLKAQCPRGSLGIMNEDGLLLCRGCSLGFYLDLGGKKCRMCEPGYYMDEIMAVECKICPALAANTDENVWRQVNDMYDKGAYSLIFCPSLKADGTLRQPYAEMGKPRILGNITGKGDLKRRNGCPCPTSQSWIVLIIGLLLYKYN